MDTHLVLAIIVRSYIRYVDEYINWGKRYAEVIILHGTVVYHVIDSPKNIPLIRVNPLRNICLSALMNLPSSPCHFLGFFSFCSVLIPEYVKLKILGSKLSVSP